MFPELRLIASFRSIWPRTDYGGYVSGYKDDVVENDAQSSIKYSHTRCEFSAQWLRIVSRELKTNDSGFLLWFISNCCGNLLVAFFYLRLGVQDLILSVFLWAVWLVFMYVHVPLARVGSELMFVPSLVLMVLLCLMWWLLASYFRAPDVAPSRLMESRGMGTIDGEATNIVDAPSDSPLTDFESLSNNNLAVVPSSSSDGAHLVAEETLTGKATLISSAADAEDMRKILQAISASNRIRNGAPDSIIKDGEVDDDRYLTEAVDKFYRKEEFDADIEKDILGPTSGNPTNFEPSINDLMREDEEDASCR
jgi:hypothetical protein